MRLIPAIDLRAGHCVRLLHGDFEAETVYPTDAYSLLTKYREAGADWLHIVDLDGARDGSLGNRAIIVDLAARRALNLQVGGGSTFTPGTAGSPGTATTVAGNLALLWKPEVHFFGGEYRLFDVGGAIGLAGMAAVLICFTLQNTLRLYREERLSQ